MLEEHCRARPPGLGQSHSCSRTGREALSPLGRTPEDPEGGSGQSTATLCFVEFFAITEVQSPVQSSILTHFTLHTEDNLLWNIKVNPLLPLPPIISLVTKAIDNYYWSISVFQRLNAGRGDTRSCFSLLRPEKAWYMATGKALCSEGLFVIAENLPPFFPVAGRGSISSELSVREGLHQG